MIKYRKGLHVEGQRMPRLAYIHGRGWIGRLVLPVTRGLRIHHALKYARRGRDHLDIGCGDGSFLAASPCENGVGLDMRIGDPPVAPGAPLPFAAGSFDLVTMLAVIEHVKNPAFVVGEIARVLRPGGRLVLTTPRRSAEWLIRLYVRNIEDEHETYFDRNRLEDLVRPSLKPVGYHRFLFGLNQAFAAEKPA